MLSVLSIGAWADNTSPYAGNVVAAGDFYLYNIDTGYWLQNNETNWSNWTTCGSGGRYGIDFGISEVTGGWKLDPKFGNNHSMNASNFYFDTNNDITAWTFESVSYGSNTNVYRIKSGNNVLGMSADPNGTGYTLSCSEGNTSNVYWQLVTRAQRIAYLDANATIDKPLDATFLIKDPGLANNNERYSSWTLSRSGGNHDVVNELYCQRSFAVWNTSNFSFTQTIADITPGLYEMSFKGYYRDGNKDDVLARASNLKKYGKYYIGSEEKDVMSILDGAFETQPENSAIGGYDKASWAGNSTYGYYPDNKETFARVFWFFSDMRKGATDTERYVNSVEGTITGTSTSIGLRKTEANSNDWFAFDDFRLKYYGPLSKYSSELDAAITSAQAFTGSTTDILASNLSTALTNALSAQEAGNDIRDMHEKTEALNSALAAAEAVDVSVLRPTVAYVKARGVDVSTQETFLETGTTNDVENQKNAAILALKYHAADKSTQPTIFTLISESVVGTDDNNYATYSVDNRADGFYIYNVGTGRWFCGGDDWGAHAAVGFPGIKITTPKNNYESGHYNSVKTWLFNGNWNSGRLLNNSGYCDTGGNAWKFWKKNEAQGIYTWSNNGSNTGTNEGNGCGTKDLVGFAPSTYSRVNVHQSDDNDPYNQWIFVTEAQRDAMAAAAMATASTSNPVDLTYKIKMPGFNQRERKEGTNQDSEELDWICNHANYRYDALDNDSRKLIYGRNDNHADFVCDVCEAWNDAFSLTQTVTGLTPGRYRVKVQGYNYYGADANKAYLYANGQKTTLVDRGSESVLPWKSGLPGTTFEAPEYFQVGLYWNEVLCTVGSDGKLELGVKSPSVTGTHVFIFDNFRLEYVGLVGATVGEANYTTFVAPYHISTIPDGVEAYACQVGTDYVHLEPVTAIPEGAAVVLKNEGTYSFSPASGSVSLGTSNNLQASDGSVTGAAGNIYALAKLGGEVGFYLVNDDVTVPAGKGYLSIGGSVKAFYGFEEDDADGICPLLTSPEEEEHVYNLAGQKLSKMQKGVNIVNGRKVLF